MASSHSIHLLPRLYVTDTIHKGAVIALTKDQCHYLKHVMRRKLSDPIRIFNGRDGEWLASIISLEKNMAQLSAQEELSPQRNEPDVTLLFAPIKQGRIDWLVEKATELGVSVLQPVITERTMVRRIKEERLQSHVIEAAEQTERLTLPVLRELTTLEALLKEWPEEITILMCDETGKGRAAREVLPSLDTQKKYALLIGPEGGFSQDELDLLHKLPYVIPIGMGPRIMRADTAALAILSCWQMSIGDWNILPAFRS